MPLGKKKRDQRRCFWHLAFIVAGQEWSLDREEGRGLLLEPFPPSRAERKHFFSHVSFFFLPLLLHPRDFPLLLFSPWFQKKAFLLLHPKISYNIVTKMRILVLTSRSDFLHSSGNSRHLTRNENEKNWSRHKKESSTQLYIWASFNHWTVTRTTGILYAHGMEEKPTLCMGGACKNP